MKSELKNIQNLIFDFGGVLVDLDRTRCENAFTAIGVDASAMLGSYRQAGLLSEFEEGKITPPQFFEGIRALSTLATPPTDRQIWDAWDSFLVEIPRERLDVLIALKEKYSICLLSNTNFIHWVRACNDLFLYKGHTVSWFFEKIFLSFEMHVQKPAPEMFRTVLRETGFAPAGTLFIDDSPANCRAAMDATGMSTYCPPTGGEWINLFDNIVP